MVRALTMTSPAAAAKRGDGRLWATALGLSLLCNAALLFVAGLAVIESQQFQHPTPSATPHAESLRFIAPEVAATAPDPAVAATQAAGEPAKEVLLPGHDPSFARTSDDQRGKRPDHPAFIGERDTQATSDATPAPNAPAMPAQAGIQPRFPGELETTESHYQDGALTDSAAPPADPAPPSAAPSLPSLASPPSPPSDPALAPATAASGETTDSPGSADKLSSPAPPTRLAEGPNPVDLPVPLTNSQQPHTTAVQSLPRAGTPDGLPTANDLKTAKAIPTPRETPKDPAFRGNQRKTAIQGSISRRGRSALDVEDSPLGRYQATISRAVELEWQRNCMRNRDVITPGYLTVRFFVDTKGKVRNIQFVGAMQTGQLQKSFTLNSIQAAAIPAMPAEVSKDFQDDPLEFSINFYF